MICDIVLCKDFDNMDSTSTLNFNRGVSTNLIACFHSSRLSRKRGVNLIWKKCNFCVDDAFSVRSLGHKNKILHCNDVLFFVRFLVLYLSVTELCSFKKVMVRKPDYLRFLKDSCLFSHIQSVNFGQSQCLPFFKQKIFSFSNVCKRRS